MMRLRRVSLLVAFYLITSAATAHAECAWVLWRIPQGTPKGDPEYARAGFATVIEAAYASRQECEAAKTADAAIGSNEFDPDGKPRAWITARQVCLPDTVDPRGPKGGGR